MPLQQEPQVLHESGKDGGGDPKGHARSHAP
jgi:hypothetical protein